jgi:alpha-D-ribose 1-methylphosphonate 5-triphosphate synthase subunit PhnH
VSIAIELETARDRDAREAFLCMVNALNLPGRVAALPPAAGRDTTAHLNYLARALLDLECSFYTDSDAIEHTLFTTGAWHTTIDRADYAFIESLDHCDADLLARLRTGEFANPDFGATVFVGCEIDAADAPLRCWRGPGIPGEQIVQLGGIPEWFWATRDQLISYPLGFDTFFVGAGEVIGLPRTTRVTRCM